MRPLVYRLALLSCLIASACSKSGTYVHLRFSAAGDASLGQATQIDVTATLAGQTAKATIGNGKSLTLPADAVLDIRHNEGALTVMAVLRGAGGAILANASGGGTVKRGETLDLALVFMATTEPPPGMTDDMAMGGGMPGVDMAAADDMAHGMPGTPMLTIDHLPSFDFGSVAVGTSSSQVTLTVTNNGDAPSSALAAASVDDTSGQFNIAHDGCKGQTLIAGASCSVLVELDGKTVGTPSTTITVGATSGGTVSTLLKGTVVAAGFLTFSPTSQDYKGVTVGSFADQSFTISNGSTVRSGAISAKITGTDSASFSVRDNKCDGVKLAPGDSCTLTVRFSAGSAGSRVATLEADATPGGPALANLQGLAQNPATLALAPGGTTRSFDIVDANTSANLTFTLSNSGDLDAGALPAQPWLSGDAAFTLGNGTCAASQVLKGGQSCTIIVTFKPTTYGARQASLTVGATPGGSFTVALSGTGRVTNALTVAPSGSGKGAIASIPAGDIDCGASCSKGYQVTTSPPTITLQATPDISSTFSSWTNCTPVSGVPTQCQVTMDGAKSVTAVFAIKPATLAISPSTTTSLGFANIGSSTQATFTITNSGYATSGNLSAQSWISGNAAFTVGGGTCAAGSPIAGQSSCTVIVKFTPTAEGALTGTLALSASPGGSLSVGLTGSACKSGGHMCTGASTCYANSDRSHCGTSCGTCTVDQVCDATSCVLPPHLTLASQPLNPTGWTDGNNKPIQITINPAPYPDVTYECSTGPEAAFTPTPPAFVACDGGSGTGLVHTPTATSGTPNGSYRTDVRMRQGTYASSATIVQARYYVHDSLAGKQPCPRNATDAPHFTDDQMFAAALNFKSDKGAFPTPGTFPAPSSALQQQTDAIVTFNPFIKIPFVGVTNTVSMNWAGVGPNFTLTTPSLRHRFALNATRSLLLYRRIYPAPQLNSCSVRVLARTRHSDLGSGFINCDAIVLNTAGQGLCMIPSPDGKSPVPMAFDTNFNAKPGPANVTVSATANSTTITASAPGGFDPTMKAISTSYGWLRVASVQSATTATLVQPAPATFVQKSWSWGVPTDFFIIPAAYAKLFGENGHVKPEYHAKCTSDPKCNSGKPWLLYLPP